MSLRRVAAALALVLVLGVVVVTIVTVGGDLPRVLAQPALFAVVLVCDLLERHHVRQQPFRVLRAVGDQRPGGIAGGWSAAATAAMTPWRELAASA